MRSFISLALPPIKMFNQYALAGLKCLGFVACQRTFDLSGDMPPKKRPSGRYKVGQRTKANGYTLKSGWSKGRFDNKTRRSARNEVAPRHYVPCSHPSAHGGPTLGSCVTSLHGQNSRMIKRHPSATNWDFTQSVFLSIRCQRMSTHRDPGSFILPGAVRNSFS